jgi:hypothetical protein
MQPRGAGLKPGPKTNIRRSGRSVAGLGRRAQAPRHHLYTEERVAEDLRRHEAKNAAPTAP